MKSLEEIAEYFGIEKLPKIAGTKSGPLLVMGTAKCVWDDIKDLRLLDYSTLAVKEVSWFFVRITGRPLDHAASYEEEVNIHFTQKLYSKGIPLAAKNIHTISTIPVKKAHIWDTTKHCGTSGLFGIMVGVLMGYHPVIIAGCPVDGSPHFYDPDYLTTEGYTRQGQQSEYRKACEIFKGRAYSLSGNTRKWLGES